MIAFCPMPLIWKLLDLNLVSKASFKIEFRKYCPNKNAKMMANDMQNIQKRNRKSWRLSRRTTESWLMMRSSFSVRSLEWVIGCFTKSIGTTIISYKILQIEAFLQRILTWRLSLKVIESCKAGVELPFIGPKLKCSEQSKKIEKKRGKIYLLRRMRNLFRRKLSIKYGKC